MSIDLLFETSQRAILSSVDILAISAQLGFYSPAGRFSTIPAGSEAEGIRIPFSLGEALAFLGTIW